MAPPRPYWKGYLKLSLVSCPVAVYSAISSGERVAFKQISRQSGHRLKQQLVDEHTGDPVDSADKARGYEVGKGDYMLVEDDELEAVAIESQHTIDIDRFVPRAQIDERYLDAPYYLLPNDKVGQDAFAVIRDAMRGKGMVALGRVVLAKRERVIMLQAWGKGLMGTTLSDTPTRCATPPVISTSCRRSASRKTCCSSPSTFSRASPAISIAATFADRYEEAVVAMLRTKQSGRTVSTTEPRFRDEKVFDLMEALRRSIAGTPKPVEALGKKAKTKPDEEEDRRPA